MMAKTSASWRHRGDAVNSTTGSTGNCSINRPRAGGHGGDGGGGGHRGVAQRGDQLQYGVGHGEGEEIAEDAEHAHQRQDLHEDEGRKEGQKNGPLVTSSSSS